MFVCDVFNPVSEVEIRVKCEAMLANGGTLSGHVRSCGSLGVREI